MSKPYVTGEEAEELKRINAALPEAGQRAEAALATHGMESREFFEADAAHGKLLRRRREICGG